MEPLLKHQTTLGTHMHSSNPRRIAINPNPKPNLDLWLFNHKTILLAEYPKFIPSLNTLESFVFELCSGKQTNRQTDGFEYTNADRHSRHDGYNHISCDLHMLLSKINCDWKKITGTWVNFRPHSSLLTHAPTHQTRPPSRILITHLMLGQRSRSQGHKVQKHYCRVIGRPDTLTANVLVAAAAGPLRQVETECMAHWLTVQLQIVGARHLPNFRELYS